MSLVFYDTETTGMEPAFDQILQFAAIRVDHALQELERFEVGSRLLPHTVPSPEAMRVNRTAPERLVDASLLSHYGMVCAIRAKLTQWTPSIIMGFNSLGYDEHMLRHALYRTLHPPYLTNTNRNARSDVLRLARASTVFAPGVICIPTNEWRQPLFDLQSLARANGFNGTRAHTAMEDVEATLHLARLIMDGAPALWSGFMRFAQKSAVVDHARDEPIFCLTDFYSGRAYSWLVTSIGSGSQGELIVYDLQVDPDELIGLTDDDLAERLREQPKPLKRLRPNACPVIVPADDAPDICAARFLGQSELERRAELLRTNATFAQRLVVTFESLRTPRDVSLYVEAQLYNGFFSDEDSRILDLFHAAPWHERPSIVARLGDPRLRALGEELIYFEQPNVMAEAQRLAYGRHHARRLMGGTDELPWMTLPKAIGELTDALLYCDDADRPFLSRYLDFLSNWAGIAGRIAA